MKPIKCNNCYWCHSDGEGCTKALPTEDILKYANVICACEDQGFKYFKNKVWCSKCAAYHTNDTDLCNAYKPDLIEALQTMLKDMPLEYQKECYIWIGVNRNNYQPETIEQIQDILGPLKT